MILIPEGLKQAVEVDNLVLFIGAGLSYKLKNENGETIGGWENLVEQILNHLETEKYEVAPLKALVGQYEPVDILNLIEKNTCIPKNKVISFVKNFFILSPKNNYKLHCKLCKLSSIIITTNYDKAFEKALPLLETRTASIGRKFEIAMLRRIHEPVLFKLHGCISDGHHMVLFPSNYNNLYYEQNKDAEHIISELKNLIYNKTLLFIGCGMGDFQINRILLRVKELQGTYHQHFIISKEEVDERLTEDNFLKLIKIKNYSEIDGIIDALLRIKEETPEVNKLKKDLDETNRKLEEANRKLKEIENRDKRLSYEYMTKGLKFHMEGNFEKAIEQYEILASFSIGNDLVYYNWGNALLNLAQTKKGVDPDNLYLEAIEKYKLAITSTQGDHKVYNDWGVALVNFAQTKTGDESDNLYREAFDKYQRAVAVKNNSKLHKAYYNWGDALADLAKTKTGDESDNLYREAFDKYQRAITSTQGDHKVYNNWGVALINFAQTKTGVESDNLYFDAFDKYQQVITINPADHDVYNNWTVALRDFAQTKTGDQAEALIKEAFEKYQKALELRRRSSDLG